MKILYTDSRPDGEDGHAAYVARLARSFQGEHQLTVATPSDKRLYEQALRIPGVRVWNMSFSTQLRPMLVEVLAFQALLREERFDLVHVNGSADHRQMTLARLGLRDRPRVVRTLHDAEPADGLGGRLRAWAGTDGAIGVCDSVSQVLMDSGYGGRLLQTVRPGIDTDWFRPQSAGACAQARRELLGELPDGVCVLGSVGGTGSDKGWLALVRALARVPATQRGRFRILVAGDPPQSSVRQEVGALGMSPYVVIPGQVDDMRRVLAASDIGFALSFQEPGADAACESLAMGLPTLVSDADGLPELVRDGAEGWVVPAGDVDALHRWLLARLAAPVDKMMAVTARERALAQFSLSMFSRQTLDFYLRVCARA